MNKLIALTLCLVLALSLTACGTAAQPTEGADPTTTAAAQDTTGAAADTTEAAQAPVDLAKSCIDKSVDELYALIGEPTSADYAPSCLNPGQGEDGMLYYDGFVVYTYKEGDTETVEDVE